MNERQIKMNSKEAFDKQADSYDYDVNEEHARRMYDEILRILNDITYTNFLDLGCGTGEMIKVILEQDSKKTGSEIDISRRMIEVAKKKLPETVHLKIGDSENLPYPNQYFDVVHCNDYFIIIQIPKKLLQKFLGY